MFEQYVTPILMKYLSAFISNLPELKLSVWNGNVVLSNLQIKPNAFAGLLPFTIVGGYIAELRITIPWASLTSNPVQVWLKRVDLNVSFGGKQSNGRPRSHSHEHESMAQAAVENPFAIPAEVAPEEEDSGGGWTASIASKIINNGNERGRTANFVWLLTLTTFQLTVEIKAEAITVRVFDTDSEDSASFTIGSVHLYSCDANFAGRLFVDPSIVDYMRKVCRVEDISLVVSSLQSDSSIISGVSATVRVEHLGTLKNVILSPPDGPTTRVDVRITDVNVGLEESQLCFILRAITRLSGGNVASQATVDAVEVALRKLPRTKSSSSMSPQRIAMARSTGSSRNIANNATGGASVADGGKDKGWVGWLLGSDVQAKSPVKREPASDLLQFDATNQQGGNSQANSDDIGVLTSVVGIGIFVQTVSISLIEKEPAQTLIATVNGLAVNIVNGEQTIALDSAQITLGEMVVASIKGETVTSNAAPVEQWAFELFASQSGGGNKSIGIDASKRTFLPDSLFDPNGHRIFLAAGLGTSNDAGKARTDDDATFVVSEFGIMAHSPRKTGRSPNEKPNFTANNRQPLWQRGCRANNSSWHSFQALLMHIGPAEFDEGLSPLDNVNVEAFTKRPIHSVVSLCADNVSVSLVPDLVPFIVRFFARSPLAESSEPLDVGLDPTALDFGLLLDRVMSRIWRKPATSIDIRVHNVEARIDVSGVGFAPVLVRTSKVFVTDNWRGEKYPGADFISRARNYKQNPLFASKLYSQTQTLSYLLQTFTICAEKPNVSVGSVNVISANGTLNLSVATSRVHSILEYFAIDVNLKGALSGSLSTQHLQLFAHCLNMLLHQVPATLPVIAQPVDFIRLEASNFHLYLGPDVTKVAVDVISVARDAFGTILKPTSGHSCASFALTLGVSCESVQTLAKGVWRKPEMEIVLHHAEVHLDLEALVGWLLFGVSVVGAPIAEVAVTSSQAPSSSLVPLFDMFTWKWAISILDVDIALGHGLRVNIPSIEMRPNQNGGHVLAVRKLGLGALFGGQGVAFDVSILSESRAPAQPRLSISLITDEPLMAQLSPLDVEGVLAFVAQLKDSLDNAATVYAHCWGPGVMVKNNNAKSLRVDRQKMLTSETSATVLSPLLLIDLPTDTQALGVSVDFWIRLAVVDATLSFTHPASHLRVRGSAVEFRWLDGDDRVELNANSAALLATFHVAPEKHQLSLTCTRFHVRDAIVKGGRNFKLELFALGIDRLNNVRGGVAESADAILKPMNISAVRHSTAQDRQNDHGIVHPLRLTAVESGIRVTISPCVAIVDEATVGTVRSLAASLSAIRVPDMSSSPSPSSVTSSSSVPLDAAVDFYAELESVSLFVGGFNDPAKSQITLSGLIVSRHTRHFMFTLRTLTWTLSSDPKVIYLQSAPVVPFVHVSAQTGGEALMEISALSGCLTSSLLCCLVKVINGTPIVKGVSRQQPQDALINELHNAVSPPSMLATLLVPYQRCKVLVSPWNICVAAKSGSELRCSFTQAFVSTHWNVSEGSGDAVQGHVGSLTLVSFCIQSSVALHALLEPLTLMAELALSPTYVTVLSSITHPVRLHIRPSDASLLTILASEIVPLVVADVEVADDILDDPSSSVVVVPPSPIISIRHARSAERVAPVAPHVIISDLISTLSLVGAISGKHPDGGECTLSTERNGDGTVSSTMTWMTNTTHTLRNVYQRHAIPPLAAHCVATVQVQFWDVHASRFVTTGSMLLSSNAAAGNEPFASNRCVFPLNSSCVRLTEWRLLCQIRSVPGGLPTPIDVCVSPQLLMSCLCVEAALWTGDSSLTLSVPKVSVYFAHSYKRDTDNQQEEEEVVLFSVSSLRVTHTSGDGRFSVHAASSIKCVQFDDLSLVDIVEPFTTTAVHLGSSWDVRVSRVAVNASPLLCGTLAQYSRLWNDVVSSGLSSSNEFEFSHYVLHNMCSLPLACGQEGTGEELILVEMSKQKYSWQSGLGGAPRILQVWLPKLTGSRVNLDIDGCFVGVQTEVELQVELEGYPMFMRIERPSPTHRSRVVSFMGSFLFHSALALTVSISITTRPPGREPSMRDLIIPPNQSVGLIIAEGMAPYTMARFSVVTRKDLQQVQVLYPLEISLNDGSNNLEASGRRIFMEAPEYHARFWVCQTGRRLSLIPLLTVWNFTPCAVTFRCDGCTQDVASGNSAVVERLNLEASKLCVSFEKNIFSEPYPITLEKLKDAADIPQSTELRCGRHVLYLALYAERMFGGVVAVLYAKVVARNETQLCIETFAGVTPHFPEDRVVMMPALEPNKSELPPMTLTMLPWEAHVEVVSFRVVGNDSADDWRDLRDQGIAEKGIPVTLRGLSYDDSAVDHYFRYPLLARFERSNIPIPATKAYITTCTMTLEPQMTLHSRLDVPIRVRIGCDRQEHNRCKTGIAFEVPARGKQQLAGFGFGFHLSISVDKGASWSEGLLCAKEAPRTPIAMESAGQALCYSVLSAPDGSLHTTIMHDVIPPLSVRNCGNIALRVSTLQSNTASVLISPGARVSVVPREDGSATKLIVATTDSPSRFSPLLVEGDGDGQFVQLGEGSPLYFRIESLMGARIVSISQRPLPKVVSPIPVSGSGRIVVAVEEASFSLFDDQAKVEYLRLTLSHPSVDMSRRRNSNSYTSVPILTEVSITATSIQLDNHSLEAGEFPVVMAPLSLVQNESRMASKAWLSVRLSFGFCRQGMHVEECVISMQPLACYVGEAFVLYSQQQLQLISDAVALGLNHGQHALSQHKQLSLSALPSFDSIGASQRATTIEQLVEMEAHVNPYIHYLKISALSFRVTLHFNVPKVHLYLGMDNSRLSIREVVMHHLSMPPSELLANLLKLYTTDVIAGSPSLLGSLQILGNPASLVFSVVNGMYDFIGMPMKGVRDMDALAAVMGIGRGSVSFLRHLSIGTLQSFSGCLSAVAKNMDALTMDEAYLLQHIRQRTLNSRQGISASLVSGFQGLGSSVLAGVVGLVQQPLAGAQENGVRGFMTGSALGVWNVLMKPLGGAVELVGSVAAGTLRSVGGGPYAIHVGPNTKRRVLVQVADVKWRRKFPNSFVQAFDCMDDKRGACVVVFTTNAVTLIKDDVVLQRAERVVSSEIGNVFVVEDFGSFTINRMDRRDFARLLKQLSPQRQD